jgi:RNA polymerase sigma factor (sigma-70 family)
MNDLIENNMGLVVSVVNSFKPKNHTEREDYIQAGRIGLWKALKKYNPDKGAVLSTYAWNPIRWEIIKEIKLVKRGRFASSKFCGPPVYDAKEEFWEILPTAFLSEEEMNFLELRKMGYKLAEMATITGRTSSYVKRIFYRAVRKIRDKNA